MSSDYSIKTVTIDGEKTAIVSYEGGEARYRLTQGSERKEVAALRREINKHLATPNGTLGNYQW